MKLVTLLSGAAVLFCGPVFAAEPAAPAPAVAQSGAPGADAASARKHDLARRYFEALHMDHMMHVMMQQMMSGLVDEEIRRGPQLPEQFKTAIKEAAVETMDSYMPQVIDNAVDVCAETFTEDELQKMVDFYESDTGRAIVAKSDLLGAKMTERFHMVAPDVQGRMLARLCRKIDCSVLPKSMQPSSS